MVMKFTYTMGASCTKLRLFFHQVSFIFWSMLHFNLSSAKQHTQSVSFRGLRRWKLEVAKSVLWGEQGLDSPSSLAEPFEFVALTSLMSVYIALNWLWHFSLRSLLTRFLHSSRRHYPWFTHRSLHLVFVHLHLPYSTNLTPFDIHLFSLLQDALQGSCFVYNDELKYSMHEELLFQCAVLHNWHTTSCIKLKKKCVYNGYLWKNNLNFVKNVPLVSTSKFCYNCNYS